MHPENAPESFAPLAKMVSGETYGIVTDHLGTPRGMFDEAGREVWAADIDAYGDLRNVRGERQACPFRWPGQYEDGETGLYYNRWRYYDRRSGRHIKEDPIGLLGGLRLHAYVSDVVTGFDPAGLKDCSFKMQPYRYGDVRVKGPHGDVLKDSRKLTKGRLVVEGGALRWKQFGDMEGVSKKDLAEADRLLQGLTGDAGVMASAKSQVESVIADLTKDLNHKNKNTRELAKRQLECFNKMLGLF
jgi:RHS repeat-associated protein